MQAIDSQGRYGEYLLDETRKIPDAHRTSVCLFEQNEKTCRYLCLAAKGFVCVKKTPMKLVIDQFVSKKCLRACGDNCEGLGDIKK